VHKSIHWCLAIINMKENTFQYLDSLGGMDTNVARVLVRIDYDSLLKFQFRQLGKCSGLVCLVHTNFLSCFVSNITSKFQLFHIFIIDISFKFSLSYDA
jgi:hypothetical protein